MRFERGRVYGGKRKPPASALEGGVNRRTPQCGAVASPAVQTPGVLTAVGGVWDIGNTALCSRFFARATLAQLVERLIRNQQVAGSIPAGGSITNPNPFNKLAWAKITRNGADFATRNGTRNGFPGRETGASVSCFCFGYGPSRPSRQGFAYPDARLRHLDGARCGRELTMERMNCARPQRRTMASGAQND
jgi:hypothetical protein